MSKKKYDSDFCGSLPLNHINVIQSYGYLLVVENHTFKVLQVSENAVELFDRPLQEIIGTLLGEEFDLSQLKELQGRFETKANQKIPFTIMISHRKTPVLAHFKPGYIILEVEKSEVEYERTFTKVFEEVKYAMAAIESASSVIEVSQAAVHELRKVTGFDGIMMYRFDDDWNGTVIAEEKVDELENYLGHTFPGSDVPKQARDLYLKNPYRLIPDRQYEPIRLYPVVNPVTNAFIDLSDCNLRGVAAVHLEYLKNMNVKASMSFRVIDNDKLWGLIACHHIEPLYLNFELCAICELISSVTSNRIASILHKTAREIESDLQNQQTELFAQVYTLNDINKGLLNAGGNNLMHLLHATGVVSNFQNDYQQIGAVPDRDMIENLFLWLQNKQVEKIFYTDHLPELFEEALPYPELASGLLAIPLNLESGEFIIAFRPEVVQTINWGGDPNKTINFEPDGKKYHPRASFKIWKQQVNNTSSPWSKQELAVAENLRTFLYELITKSKG
ncbi:GAF domain-containing protein [Mucilaginibacter sp.]|uniref:GAF domain-containing protein n=1 Tax=Mucilaginibacter sp. TaxID=1882438 RepID=UPI0025D24C7C|nr:GAF domain-containing protein [Mucilaginibacter sp.]